MKASTLKIENPLLKNLYKLKPKTKSFSAFVRELLEQAIRSRESILTANQYQEFLKNCPDEEKWLEEWEKADLTIAPKRLKREKSH